jgi:hypothetical protein
MDKLRVVTDEELLKFWHDKTLIGIGKFQEHGMSNDSWCKAVFSRISCPELGRSKNYAVSAFMVDKRHEFHIKGDYRNVESIYEMDRSLRDNPSLEPVVGFGRFSGCGSPSLDYFALFLGAKPVYEGVFRNEHVPVLVR